MVRIGTNEDEAKVFRAHAIPQGLCENLIIALKLLANQQEDGDSQIQNIVVGLEEKCRQRVYEWADNAVQWRWVTCVEASGPSKSCGRK